VSKTEARLSLFTYIEGWYPASQAQLARPDLARKLRKARQSHPGPIGQVLSCIQLAHTGTGWWLSCFFFRVLSVGKVLMSLPVLCSAMRRS